MRGILVMLLTALLVSGAAMAAEHGDDAGTGDTTGTTGDAGEFDGNVTRVTIEPAVGSEVCWSVEGSGTIRETSIRWDDESHADTNATADGGTNATGGMDNATDDNTTGTMTGGTTDDTNMTGDEEARAEDYDGGQAFPANEVIPMAEGYALPGRFCANLTASQDTVYVVAHAATEDGPGVLSEEIEVQATTGTVVCPPEDTTGGTEDNMTTDGNATGGSDVSDTVWPSDTSGTSGATGGTTDATDCPPTTGTECPPGGTTGTTEGAWTGMDGSATTGGMDANASDMNTTGGTAGAEECPDDTGATGNDTDDLGPEEAQPGRGTPAVPALLVAAVLGLAAAVLARRRA